MEFSTLPRRFRREPRAATVVELTYFGGLTSREVAAALEISRATAERDLRFARSWLRRELAGEMGSD